MAETNDIDSKDAEWIVVVPVEQLDIPDEPPVGGEWPVGDIVFRSTASLEKYLAPPHIRQPVSKAARERVFGPAKTFATAVRKGTPRELRQALFRDFRNSANVLAATAAVCGRRRHQRGFAIRGDSVNRPRDNVFVEIGGDTLLANFGTQGPILPFSLDGVWHAAIVEIGANKVFERIVDPHLHDQWRRQIFGAAALLGRSFMSVDLADAFLMDVIGLETLLTRQGERNGRRLAKRIKGLTGWHLRRTRPNYESEIEELHQVRCQIVHDADYSNLTIERVLQADMYLANSLLNIVNHPNLFPDKAALASVADAYADHENWPNDDSVVLKWIGSHNFHREDLKLQLW